MLLRSESCWFRCCDAASLKRLRSLWTRELTIEYAVMSLILFIVKRVGERAKSCLKGVGAALNTEQPETRDEELRPCLH